ncbi:MAG: hypothetical protein R2825_24165 [Saprospiraceae bacterium]|jgi:hypothetical protein
MKGKILNLGLILTSLIGYLEWGKDNSSFLFQTEFEIFKKLISDPISAFHPFTILPLFGQILLAITLFQKKTSKLLTYLGLGGIGILLLFMFAIGIIGLNYKIALSTLPFLITGYFAFKHHRNTDNK